MMFEMITYSVSSSLMVYSCAQICGNFPHFQELRNLYFISVFRDDHLFGVIGDSVVGLFKYLKLCKPKFAEIVPIFKDISEIFIDDIVLGLVQVEFC